MLYKNYAFLYFWHAFKFPLPHQTLQKKNPAQNMVAARSILSLAAIMNVPCGDFVHHVPRTIYV